MKNIFLIFLICIITFSCNLNSKGNLEEALFKFNKLPDLDKIEYFNSLHSKTQFYILNNYLAGKCFESPIYNALKFKKNGNVIVDWYTSDGYGLINASGKEEPFKRYIPFNWEIKNASLIIKKTNLYSVYINDKGNDDLIFIFDENNEMVFDKVFLSLFQNKIQVTIKNKEHQTHLNLTTCKLWPVMDSD